MYKLFFGGVSQDTTETDIYEYFSSFGVVLSVSIVYDEKKSIAGST